MTMAEVSRNLGVNVILLAQWKRKMTEDQQKQTKELTESERQELVRLRDEVKRLRMERDLLKRQQHSSRESRSEVCIY